MGQLRNRTIIRIALGSFVITFLLARILVYLIMAKRIPDLFLHLGGTHVHHLNYGIFALSVAGAWLLFWPPPPRTRQAIAVLYGVGMALTFDEFGMWLHLGGSYWQRSSFDAVIIVTSLLALLGYGADIRQLSARTVSALVLAAVLAGYFLYVFRDYERLLAAAGARRLHHIENEGPR